MTLTPEENARRLVAETTDDPTLTLGQLHPRNHERLFELDNKRRQLKAAGEKMRRERAAMTAVAAAPPEGAMLVRDVLPDLEFTPEQEAGWLDKAIVANAAAVRLLDHAIEDLKPEIDRWLSIQAQPLMSGLTATVFETANAFRDAIAQYRRGYAACERTFTPRFNVVDMPDEIFGAENSQLTKLIERLQDSA